MFARVGVSLLVYQNGGGFSLSFTSVFSYIMLVDVSSSMLFLFSSFVSDFPVNLFHFFLSVINSFCLYFLSVFSIYFFFSNYHLRFFSLPPISHFHFLYTLSPSLASHPLATPAPPTCPLHRRCSRRWWSYPRPPITLSAPPFTILGKTRAHQPERP